NGKVCVGQDKPFDMPRAPHPIDIGIHDIVKERRNFRAAGTDVPLADPTRFLPVPPPFAAIRWPLAAAPTWRAIGAITANYFTSRDFVMLGSRNSLRPNYSFRERAHILVRMDFSARAI